MILTMLYHKTYCNKINCSARCGDSRLKPTHHPEGSLFDSASQMDYSIKLSYYYHKRFLIIRGLQEGRGYKYGAVSPENASDVTGRGGEIGIRARLRISWS